VNGGYVITVDGQGSPIKRQRTIVESDNENPPFTPRKINKITGAMSNQWDSIHNDPTHAFHSRSSALFGSSMIGQTSGSDFNSRDPESPTSAARTAVYCTPSSTADTTVTHVQALKFVSQHLLELERLRDVSEKSVEVNVKHIDFLEASLERERQKVRQLEKRMEDMQQGHEREINKLRERLGLEREMSEHSRAGAFD